MHSWMKIMKRAVHGLMWCAHLYVHLLIHTYSILVCWALLTGTLLTSENMILCPCQVKVLPNGGKEQTVNKHIRCLQWQHPTSEQGSVVTKCRWVESNNQKGHLLTAAIDVAVTCRQKTFLKVTNRSWSLHARPCSVDQGWYIWVCSRSSSVQLQFNLEGLIFFSSAA